MRRVWTAPAVLACILLLISAGCASSRDASREIDGTEPTAADVQAVDTGTVAIDTGGKPVVVRFQFGWRQGMVADVETIKKRINVTTESADTTSVTSRHRMSVATHPDGLLIQHTGFELADIEGADPDLEGLSPDMMQSLSGLIPSLVVSREGEFVGIDTIRGLRELLNSIFPSIDTSASPELQQFVESFLSEETLTYFAAQEWNIIVGTWVGGELEVDATYGYEAEETIPLFGGATLPMEYEFAVLDQMPCTSAENAPACAKVAMVSKPNGEALKTFITDVTRRLGAAEADELFEHVDVENTVEVTLEPATMRPHRLYTEKRISVEGDEPGKGAQSVLRVDERVTTYTYIE